MKIFLITEDEIIIDFIKKYFSIFDIIYFSNELKINELDFKNFSFILIDNIKENINFLSFFKNNNIINISNKKYDELNIININQPFKLKDLYLTIENILNKKIILFKNFKIINNVINYNNIEIVFADKELEILKKIYDNKKISKKDLLKIIWNFEEDFETKVVENTINKIKQKLKIFNFNDFIIYDKGFYFFNEKY